MRGYPLWNTIKDSVGPPGATLKELWKETGCFSRLIIWKYISQHSWQTNLFEGDSQEPQDWPLNNEFSIFHSPQPIIFFLPCTLLLLFNIYASYKCAQHCTISKGQCNNTFSQSIGKDPHIKSNGRGIQGKRKAGRWMDSWSFPVLEPILGMSTFCWILAPLLCCGWWEEMTSPCLWLFHTCFVNRGRNSDSN